MDKPNKAPTFPSQPPLVDLDPVIRMAMLVAITGLSDATLYDKISRGVFPKPFKLFPGGRAAGWRLSTIQSWLSKRESEAA